MGPLSKRLPREFKRNLGKWLGIIALLTLTISLVAGYLMAGSSISSIMSESDEKYRVEDGRFTTNFKVSDGVIDKIEDLGVEVYENFSFKASLEIPNSNEAMGARVYLNRGEVDLAYYFEGTAPAQGSEIALDRVFCRNNGIEVGDAVKLNGQEFTLSGIMSLSDYQALFENNTDFMLNAQTFSVAQVSSEGYARFTGESCSYTYSFLAVDCTHDDKARVDLEEEILDVLEDENVALTEFLDRDANQAIGFIQQDLEGDTVVFTVLLYLLIVILSFVFVVLTSATIEEESAIIGTLLASGYRKSELLLHYLALPLFSGVIGAVVGNVLGYTFFIRGLSGLYYNSYSLPPFRIMWDWGVFAQSTLLPLGILIVISLVGLMRKLNCAPLQFLRHEISKRSRKGGRKLPDALSFSSRFRLRVLGRNAYQFVLLFAGIFFATLLLIFGFCLMPTMDRYAGSLSESLAAQHTYTLKAPVELEGSKEEREANAAALKLVESVDLSGVDQESVKEKLTPILEERIEAEISSQMASGALRSSSIDLTRFGLGVVDMTTFDLDSITADSIDFDEIDLSDVGKEDLGLENVDLGGLSLGEFLSLLQKASRVDDGAHAVNTQENDAAAIDQAEKFTAVSLEYDRGGASGWEDVVLYGIQDASRYYDMELSDTTAVVGAGLVKKFNLEVGDTISLYDKYEGKTYDFKIGSVWGNECTMNIYMPIQAVNLRMGYDADHFSGYLSDMPLSIDRRYLLNDMTPSDMEGITAQMQDSFSDMMGIIVFASVAIFLVLIYLLTKTIIERNARSMSYMKVFGYTDAEINKLYVRSITEAVAVSLIASAPLAFEFLSLFIKVVFVKYNGNFVMELPLDRIAIELALGIACYAVVAFLHTRRIKKVPMALALKVQE